MASSKILVVEDEASLQEFLRYNLTKAGYHPVAAHSGFEALEIARREAPSLMLLDLMLPDMDGLDVCKRLKSKSDTMGSASALIETVRGVGYRLRDE